MATRAQNFTILATGVLYNAALITTPYVKFLAAGTSTAKNAWDDKDKSVAITKKALDAQGRAEVYGDGIYKLEFYTGDPDAGGVKLFELDNQKCVAVFGDTRTVTAATVTGSVDDNIVVADTTSNTITYTLPDATLVEGRTITLKKKVAANTLTINTTLSQSIDDGSTVSITAQNIAVEFFSDGANWYKKQVSGDASTLDGIAASGYVQTDEANLKVKIVDIGAWDMDATTTVTVQHGFADATSIRAWDVSIRADASANVLYKLETGTTASAGSVAGRSWISGVDIALSREAGGVFDGTGYDDTGINRGHVTIWYVA